MVRGAWSLFKAWFYVGYIVYTAFNARVWWIFLGLGTIYVLQVIKYFLVNFWLWRRRKDLQVPLSTLFFFPINRSIMAIYRFYGYWRSLLMYIPIVKSPKKVLGLTKEVEKKTGNEGACLNAHIFFVTGPTDGPPVEATLAVDRQSHS